MFGKKEPLYRFDYEMSPGAGCWVQHQVFGRVTHPVNWYMIWSNRTLVISSTDNWSQPLPLPKNWEVV